MTMSRYRLAQLALAGLIALFASSSPGWAKCPPACVAQPQKIVPVLAIQGLSPSGSFAVVPGFVPLEHSVLGVHYSLTATIGGIVPPPAPVSGYVCAVTNDGDDCQQGSNTNSFSSLTASSNLSGTVGWRAPAATENASFELQFCQTQPAPPPDGRACHNIAASSVFSTPVSANYEVSIQDFTINHTRAPHNDTVAITLLGGMYGSGNDTVISCGQTASGSCVQNVLQGDLNNGTYSTKGAKIGSFNLVPGREIGVRFGFAIYNIGAGYSNASYNALTAQVSSLLRDALVQQIHGGDSFIVGSEPDYTDKINGLGWNGCDGPLAVDLANVIDQGASAFPPDRNNLRPQTNAIGKLVQRRGPYEFKSQAGCGPSPQYSLEFSVVRTSWEASH